MKRFLNLTVVSIAVSTLFIGGVNATNLTEQITVNDSLEITTIEKSYNAENDVNEMKVIVTANEDIISRVLGHVAGNSNSPALLGRYYFEFNPNLDGTGLTFKKNNKEYTGTLADGIAAVTPTIAGESAVNYSRVWLVALNVQYFDNVSSTWKDITNTSSGGKSVGQNLAELLGVTQSELVYGTNFRFYMSENTSKIYGWEIFENGVSTNKYEYLNVTYELKFPITGIMNGRGFYYTDLVRALRDGVEKVAINKDLTLTDSVAVPEGIKLIIADDAKLIIPKDVELLVPTLENLEGIENINKEGSIFVGDKELFFIKTIAPANGNIAVDKNTANEGDEVTITTTPATNYKLKALKVVNLATGAEVVVTNGKFTMPASDVEISAEFAVIETEMSPKTADMNLTLVMGSMLIAGLGMAVSYRKLKNRY